jgi:ubiquinone/menaquinone biosynthesis C-methylase UbiE
LPSIPDVHERLQVGPISRVADLGCGTGWSCIAVAQAYPKVRVDGFDLDDSSIALARANAADAGLSDRVRFEVRDVSDPLLTGSYELVLACDTLTDVGQPTQVLRVMRGLVANGGAALVLDVRVNDLPDVPGGDVERLVYAWSVLLSLPVARAHPSFDVIGAMLRPSILQKHAVEAGFHEVESLPIGNDLWRLYRLRT